ncbi:MAG: PAS domain S-box protein [Desulfosalsimonadaceae bacterium]
MKVWLRLLIALFLSLGVLLSGLLTIWHWGRTNVDLVLANRRQESQLLLGKLIELKGKSLESFCYDYTFWDDMVTFVEAPDPEWARENIDMSLTTFSARAAWVCAPDFTLVYSVSDPSDETLKNLPLPRSTLEHLFKQNRFAHFFIMLPNGLMEIRSATIHPTDDQERKTLPRGYFFVGRYWTKELLSELAELIGGTVRLETGREIREPLEPPAGEDRPLRLQHVFSDWAGRPVARAEALVSSPLVQQFSRSAHWLFVWVSSVSGLLALIFSIMILLWVAAPLRKISDSLDTGDASRIVGMERNPTEFGHIARLIAESMRQKEKLLREIAERKRVEESLLESEEKYRTILDNIADGYYEVDAAGNLTFFNNFMCKILGYANAELMGMNFRAYMDPENAGKVFQTFNRVFTTGEPSKAFDWEIIHKDGSKCHIDASVSVIRNESAHVAGFRGIVRDVTERKAAEQALIKSQEQYRGVVENASDAIIILQDSLIVFHNQRTETLTGYSREELAEIPFIHFVIPGDRPAVSERHVKTLNGERFDSAYSFEIMDKNGHEISVEANTALISWQGTPAVQCFIRDVTLQKKLETQLHQSHKLESIGTLAGGIAHDFNNIIGIILANAELMILNVPDSSPTRKNLKTILSACGRARDVVKQILSFSSQTEQKRMPVMLGSIVQESLKLLRSSIPATIDIRTAIPEESNTIMADPVQIHQVVINLCTNAAHAMKEKGGILEVSLKETILDENSVQPYAGFSPGRYMNLSVSDAGDGIDPKKIGRIFDPYFTTKKIGEGSGMGLAVVHGIVKNHGGAITVQSEIGKGTVFRILFPKIEAEMVPEKKITEKLPRGKERILYVDDEPSLVEIGKQMLEHLGYRVESKTSPVAALELFQADPHGFDLVITDMTMPQMTGNVLAQELIRVRPDIPVILNTGYSDQMDEARAFNAGISAYVMKPLTAMQLAKAVRSVLDKSEEK